MITIYTVKHQECLKNNLSVTLAAIQGRVVYHEYCMKHFVCVPVISLDSEYIL